MKIAKAYRIETDRLVIRCYQPSDASKLKEAIDNSLDHLLPWMPWAKNEPEDLETKINRLRQFRGWFDLDKDYVFGIFDKEEASLIGSTGLHTRVGDAAREIGYWISAAYTGKGFATEAVSALTKVGFEIEDLERIEIHCSLVNLRSQNITRKLGYKLEATLLQRAVDTYGNPRDTMIWSIFKAAYAAHPIKQMELKVFDAIGRRLLF